MNHLPARLRLPLITSTAFTLPFILLEWINRREFREDFPFALFTALWLLSLGFVLILQPIVRGVKNRGQVAANPAGFWTGAAALLLIALLLGALLFDQMPCFLGVPNCD